MNASTSFVDQDIVLVAAMARARAIGQGGGMPWRLPADLKWFRDNTLGHSVVMGRRTFESIGRPLPGRRNLVISRRRPELPEGVELAEGLDQALLACADARRVMIIGGGEIYRQALPLATHLVLTFIDGEFRADTFFPEWSPGQWHLQHMSARAADAANPCRLVFCRFRREPRP